MSYRSVDAYVDDLAWRLRVGMRGRRRITREVAAHLADLVAEEEAAGLTPQAAARRATARFGAPEELAAEFNRDSALHSARSAAWALAVSVGAAFVAAGLAQREAPANPWPNDVFYYGLPVLLVQVAAFSAGTAFLLAVLAPWLLRRPPRSLGIAARAQMAAVAALAPVAVVSAGNVTDAGRAEGALSAFVALAVPVAAWFSVRAALRADRSPGTSTLDVIADCCEDLALRWSPTARLHASVTRTWTAAVGRAPHLMSWLELRRHPWRAAATVSVAAGVALKLPDLLLGDVDLPAAAVEAVAAYIGFVLFGGLLGLRARVRTAEPLDALGAEG
ncbi:permease prefix domain 1-containing protein [Catenulispora subtropica]|uniref:Integral membrane protein n=1 Tax=Catenulispora subtropica TaxID=450798 RepID=A0ABN2T535_9ACTN